MFSTLVGPRGARFWLPFVTAVSMVTFLVGMLTGSGLVRGQSIQGSAARDGVAGVSITLDAPLSDVQPHSLSSAAWEELYGPTAATWGVSAVRPYDLSGAAWGDSDVPPHR
jgi:hypothetical protein